MDNTIIQGSGLGKHLEKIRKTRCHCLKCKGSTYPLSAQITIGRDRKNQVVLDDNLVSREHALVQKIKEAFFITDLNSTNGTFINEQKIDSGVYIKLCLGDVIRIGKCELKIT